MPLSLDAGLRGRADHGTGGRGADGRGEGRAFAPARGAAERIPRPRLGHPRRTHCAGDPEAAQGQLLPELSRAAPHGREGPRGGDPGSLCPWRLYPVRWTTWSRPWARAACPGARSAGFASRSTNRVNAFLARPLEGAWPYLWLDATYLKVREGGRIVSRAVIIAVAVNEDGKREGEPLMRHWFKHNGERRRDGAFGSRDLLDRLPAHLADRGLCAASSWSSPTTTRACARRLGAGASTPRSQRLPVRPLKKAEPSDSIRLG